AATAEHAASLAKVQPSHPDLFRVDFKAGTYASRLLTMRAFRAGETICTVTTATSGPKRYSTVQVSHDAHIELNSDLLYMNHSCDPTCRMLPGAPGFELQVIARHDIPENGEMTFFYSSTEWVMAQPFDCWCGAELCLRRIAGAKDVPLSTLAAIDVSDHI
ncbi:hypothetical protein GQ42DRAFT_103517, partial [Ramicandelaber brevisporus]